MATTAQSLVALCGALDKAVTGTGDADIADAARDTEMDVVIDL